MQITNKHRKKQLDLFIDKDHKVMSKFYDIIEQELPTEQLVNEMYKLIELDQNFFDPYLIITDILFAKRQHAEAKKLLRLAYEHAITEIVDYKGQWPKEMSWCFLENRHIMRVIDEYASLCWEEGMVDKALDIFRNLLRVNPNDNQGARYSILAIRLGLGIEEWQEPFKFEKDGEIIGLDGIKTQEWFLENAMKFPEDFEWLINFHESEG